MHPPYYGHYYRRPSRLFWFFLGGAAVVIFQNKFKEGRSFGWWHDRRRVEDTPSDGTEPLWKLRGEKEKERREAEFHKDMDNARDKMLQVTESGLNSLRQSLESLTKMVQEQRKENPSRSSSPVSDRNH